MTDDVEPNSPELAARIASRRRASLILAAALLVLLGAAAALILSRFQSGGDGPNDDIRDARDVGTDRLRPHVTPTRPVPAGAVDVLVIERGSRTPVPGVDVALVRDLRDDAANATTGTTASDGHVLLRGDLPAFLEVRSDLWTSDPWRSAVDERTRVVIEVSPRTPFVVRLADEATGLAVTDWTVRAVGDDAASGVRTDGTGTATLSPRGRVPEVLAASDGGRRVRAFLLAAIPGRSDVRLEVSAPTRTTTIRCTDDALRAIEGAIVSVGSASSGVSIACDERGEATIEYGAREAVTLVVAAPGRFPRVVRVDGATLATTVLLPTGTRRFRLRTADGTVVQQGQRLRGFTRGPNAYGIDGAGLEFTGRATGDSCDVPELPAGPFEALIWVEGPGISTIARVSGSDDTSQPIEIVAGPGRRFTLSGIPGDGMGGASTAVVRTDGARACEIDVTEGARDVTETFARGRAIDPLGACFVVRGPDAEIAIPRSTDPRRVEVMTSEGAFACFVVTPEDAGGPRPLAFTDTRAAIELPLLIARIEWAEGGAAEMTSIEVRRDERLAEPVPAMTDSSGTTGLRLAPGRYVVGATGSDGTRFAGEGPILVPSQSPVTVRLRAIAR